MSRAAIYRIMLAVVQPVKPSESHHAYLYCCLLPTARYMLNSKIQTEAQRLDIVQYRRVDICAVYVKAMQ
jgi:hypothetical protein